MKSSYKITIPKPCHANWRLMTLKEKGRFCNSCSKTVIDFTKQSDKEIQEYLIENKNKSVCGHFYKKQLASIVIEIPELTFHQKLSFQKLFILTLFFVMGTTLFSCKYESGKKKKIEKTILIDSAKQAISNSNAQLEKFCAHKNDTIIDNIALTKEVHEEDTIEGPIDVLGEVAIEEDDDIIMGVIIPEFPRFKEAKNLSRKEAKKDFDTRIQKLLVDNFNKELTQNLELPKGKYRIFTQFTIDENGKSTDIKIKAPHPKLEKEVLKIFKKLPQLIPAKQAGKIVKTKYSIPITFLAE